VLFCHRELILLLKIKKKLLKPPNLQRFRSVSGFKITIIPDCGSLGFKYGLGLDNFITTERT
jgi:hypothetical protein